jgi:hypothetical protein
LLTHDEKQGEATSPSSSAFNMAWRMSSGKASDFKRK